MDGGLLHGGSGDGLQVEGIDGGVIHIHLLIVTLEGSHSSGGFLHLGTLLPDGKDYVDGLVTLQLRGGQHGEHEALTMCHCPLLEIEVVRSDLSDYEQYFLTYHLQQEDPRHLQYKVPLPQGEEHICPDVQQILGHPGLFKGGVVTADSTPDSSGLKTGIWDSVKLHGYL